MNVREAPLPPNPARDGSVWLRAAARGMRRPLRDSAIATAGQTVVAVLQAWLLAGILAAALFHHAPWLATWPDWLAFLLLIPLRWWLGLYARRIAFDAAIEATTRLRQRLMERAGALGPLTLRAQASGDLITRLVDGVDALLPYFARYLPQVTAAVLVPTLLAACILPADWISGLLLLVSAPLIPVFMVLVGGAAARASRARFAQLTRLGARFLDALAGVVTLRQLGAAERVADGLAAEGEAYRRLTMQVLQVAFLSALVLEFFATVSIALVAVLIGFRLLWHELAFQRGLFILLLAPEFYLPLRALGGLRHARMDALAAAESLAAFEANKLPAAPPGATRALPPGPPRVALERVGFTHAGGRVALTDCSFELQPGRITVLVGASGAGKSTLVDLLLGFAAPQRGRICVGDCDLADVDPAAWRERVAWVPQRAHVFQGTLRDNLLLANPAADPALLARAAAASGLDAVLKRLPRGWKTPLGEHGAGLSGGELQRLALARAWLRESADLLLLDEPTAHLDAAGAAAIDAAIRRRAATCTVLRVAHRLEASLDADWVVVLDHGQVAEQGPPVALQARAGAYAALLEAGA